MSGGPDGGLSILAPAKINLSLSILGRRSDGYHLLDSLVAFPDFGDRIAIEPSKEMTLTCDGPFANALPVCEDNLVWRAAMLLRESAGDTGGATIRLHKTLPPASGIGGGSSDAAACLLALRELWDLSLDDSSLAEIGLGLGADVPVCLMRRAARMYGIGERLAPVRIPQGIGIVLVNPGVSIATADVFRAHAQSTHARTTAAGELEAFPEEWEMGRFLEFLSGWPNDLEAAAHRLCPAIGVALETLRGLPGCLLSRMSGSGASCFGLFPNAAVAASARAALKLPPGWWAAAGQLADAPPAPRGVSG